MKFLVTKHTQIEAESAEDAAIRLAEDESADYIRDGVAYRAVYSVKRIDEETARPDEARELCVTITGTRGGNTVSVEEIRPKDKEN